MADIITAIKNDPGFCVTVLAAFLAFIGILCAADLKTSKGIKVVAIAGIVSLWDYSARCTARRAWLRCCPRSEAYQTYN